jgi:energy-coupling factor transporter ATP-binding protein EcfA2
MVMKLLAKTAEERYQTAAGIEADLRRCLAAWESYGGIDRFPLGEHDGSDRLLIPEKLYGREREIDALLASFHRVVASGTLEFVLVSGYSGIGKSSVVNELHKVLVPPRGLFASGKFDQYKRDIPYATLGQAFQSLVRSLLTQNEEELGRWRVSLSDALGPNGQLMVNLVPELELVIGKQPPVAALPSQDAKNRFQIVFRHFLGVFARRTARSRCSSMICNGLMQQRSILSSTWSRTRRCGTCCWSAPTGTTRSAPGTRFCPRWR